MNDIKQPARKQIVEVAEKHQSHRSDPLSLTDIRRQLGWNLVQMAQPRKRG